MTLDKYMLIGFWTSKPKTKENIKKTTYQGVLS